MTKKNWLLILALMVLAVVYAVYFTDWFKPKIIHISHVSRDVRQRAGRAPRGTASTIPITFSFDKQIQPTEIIVVPLADWKTNKNVVPLWHLVADTNAATIKFFMYGQRLRGLKPSIPGSRPEPLQPDVTYRLFVTAGSAKGEHDFETKAAD
jgi:hypothetical protein